MCAPRPVFNGGGAIKADGWVDAKGMFMAAVGAQAVYGFCGKRNFGTSQFPAIGTALIAGDIAFLRHYDGHTDRHNGPLVLKFASRHLSDPPVAVGRR